MSGTDEPWYLKVLAVITLLIIITAIGLAGWFLWLKPAMAERDRLERACANAVIRGERQMEEELARGEFPLDYGGLAEEYDPACRKLRGEE